LIVAHASSSANVKVLLPKGSQNVRKLEEEFNKAGTAIIEFDAELGAPVIAQPIPLPNELYTNKQQVMADIEKIFGIYAVMSGDPNDAPDTYKGTVALDEYGQRRIRSKKDDIEAALNQLGKVAVQLIQKVYTKHKIIRIVQPNNISKETEVNQSIYDDLGNVIERVNDVTVGKYDIQVISGSTLPNNRWARFEYYMSLYERGIIDQIEVLKQTEVVDTEGVLQRMDNLKQMAQDNMAMQEQIKKLEGDLQTFERESVHDRKRVEVEKFKSQLNGVLENLRAASKLYESRVNDELKRRKLDSKPNKQ
jgi:cell division protein FtsB